MAISDFGTVRCFADADGVDVFFARGDEATKARVKDMKGRWNGATRRWRVECRYSRKDSAQIVSAIEESLTSAAPEWWKAALPGLAGHACVTFKYLLKIGIGGMRIDLPAGHPSAWDIEHNVPGSSRDGRSWLVPPDGVRTPAAKKAIERTLREDKEHFADVARFIGPRRIGGMLSMSPEDAAAVGLAPGSLVAADLSFFAKADPEMHVKDMPEWCMKVESLGPAEDGQTPTILQYADLGAAFVLLRGRRAQSAPIMPLGMAHAAGRFTKQKVSF